MYKTFLSLRYLMARKTNWIGMAGIMVSVAMLVMILSIMSGFLQQHRDTLRGALADMVFQPISPPNKDAEGAMAIIEAHPKVEASAPQLQWYGLFMPQGRKGAYETSMQSAIQLVELVGIDVEAEFRATGLEEAVTAEYGKQPGTDERTCSTLRPADPERPLAPMPRDPSAPRSERPKEPILIGEQLANIWGIETGEVVSIFTATFDRTGELTDEPATRDFEVVGSFRTGDNEVDQGRIYMDRRHLADFLQRTDQTWTSIVIRMENYDRDKDLVRTDLQASLVEADYARDYMLSRQFPTWEDFRAQILAAIKNEKALMGIMLTFMLVVACFTIWATLSTMVSEKRRDIGILCALGATSRGVMGLFVLIGLWEAIIGSAFGALFGVLGARYVDPFERKLSAITGYEIFDNDVYMFDEIPSQVSALGVAWIVAGAIAFTLLFAAIPAWRAASLDPVDALRYE